MGNAAARNVNPNDGGRTALRIVVAGDGGTGKSSLIVTAAEGKFPADVPPLPPPTRLPKDFFPEDVPVTIFDTSSKHELYRNALLLFIKESSKQCREHKVAEDPKAADVVVLTYACDQPQTLDRLSTFWLPKLRQLEVKVPVVVVGCKLDLRDVNENENQQVSLKQLMSPIMLKFLEIETCIDFSAVTHFQITDEFYYAQRAVLHPTAPVFDQEAPALKDQYVQALEQILILCDHDKDGALSDAELNDFQVKCFNFPLRPFEIKDVKKVVQEKLPEGVNEQGGLTLPGFIYLQALFIEKGCLDTTWTVLRKFGYNNDIRLSE